MRNHDSHLGGMARSDANLPLRSRSCGSSDGYAPARAVHPANFHADLKSEEGVSTRCDDTTISVSLLTPDAIPRAIRCGSGEDGPGITDLTVDPGPDPFGIRIALGIAVREIPIQDFSGGRFACEEISKGKILPVPTE